MAEDSHGSIRIPEGFPEFLIATAQEQYKRSLRRSRAEAKNFQEIVSDQRLAELWRRLLARRRKGSGGYLYAARPPSGSKLTDETIVQHAAISETLVQIFATARIRWIPADQFQKQAELLREDAARFRKAKPLPEGKKLAVALNAAADAYERACNCLRFEEFEKSVAKDLLAFFEERFQSPAMHRLVARITSAIVGRNISEDTVRNWVRPPRKKRPAGKAKKKL